MEMSISKEGIQNGVRGHNNSKVEKMGFDDVVRKYIEEVLMPQLNEQGIVYKILNHLTSSTEKQMAHEMYVLASEFGVNAKISYNSGESRYCFWYGNGD